MKLLLSPAALNVITNKSLEERYLFQREGVTDSVIHQLGHLLLKKCNVFALVGSGMVQNQLCNPLPL